MSQKLQGRCQTLRGSPKTLLLAVSWEKTLETISSPPWNGNEPFIFCPTSANSQPHKQRVQPHDVLFAWGRRSQCDMKPQGRRSEAHGIFWKFFEVFVVSNIGCGMDPKKETFFARFWRVGEFYVTSGLGFSDGISQVTFKVAKRGTGLLTHNHRSTESFQEVPGHAGNDLSKWWEELALAYRPSWAFDSKLFEPKQPAFEAEAAEQFETSLVCWREYQTLKNPKTLLSRAVPSCSLYDPHLHSECHAQTVPCWLHARRKEIRPKPESIFSADLQVAPTNNIIYHQVGQPTTRNMYQANKQQPSCSRHADLMIQIWSLPSLSRSLGQSALGSGMGRKLTSESLAASFLAVWHVHIILYSILWYSYPS